MECTVPWNSFHEDPFSAADIIDDGVDINKSVNDTSKQRLSS